MRTCLAGVSAGAIGDARRAHRLDGETAGGIGQRLGVFQIGPAQLRGRHGLARGRGNLAAGRKQGEIAPGQCRHAGVQLGDAGRDVVLAIEEGIGLVAVALAGERGGVGDVVVIGLHEQLGLAVLGIHRLAGGGVGIEAAARGVELDREIVAVADAHAERSRAAGDRHGAVVAGERIAQAGDLGFAASCRRNRNRCRATG